MGMKGEGLTQKLGSVSLLLHFLVYQLFILPLLNNTTNPHLVHFKCATLQLPVFPIQVSHEFLFCSFMQSLHPFKNVSVLDNTEEEKQN